MKHARAIYLLNFCILFAGVIAVEQCEAEEVTCLPQTLRVEQLLETQVPLLTQKIEASPEQISLYSSRGDAFFFTRQFPLAVSDYDRMVDLDREQDASHWRRGIAYFYDKQFDKAVAQFERYNAFDNVDRENGIWRYFSMYKAQGAEAARKELLKYEKDDREPFPDVYKLFSGDITPQQLIKKIERPQQTENEQEKRRFYGYLYLGLNESITGSPEKAMTYLKLAVDNTWGEGAGYGPNYMWHVARVQYEILQQERKKSQR